MEPTARSDATCSRSFDFRSLFISYSPEIVENPDRPFAHYCPVVRHFETF
jgi:hypothetical protein